MVVCKFGGSSVADESQIRKVKEILSSNKERRIAVVSAPGKRNSSDRKITDMLIECNRMAQENKSCRPVFEAIEKRYLSIATALKVDESDIKAKLDEVRQKIDAGAGTDYASSRGEYLSAIIISKYLGWEFVEAASYITILSDGTVDPASYERLSERFSGGGHYVMPGFYGSDEKGGLKTFSRGGSDISGAIAARAVKADLYENWTDVSGMFSADPRIVPEAKPIPEMSYIQVRELAEVGASVFHEEAIAPVIPLKMTINIKNTNRPSDSGTFIKAKAPETGKPIGVSGKGGYTLMKVRKLMLFKSKETVASINAMIRLYGISATYTLYGIDSIVWCFESSQIQDGVLDALLERMKRDYGANKAVAVRHVAVIGLAGYSLDENNATIDAAMALREKGIKIFFINAGASNSTSFFGVKEEDVKIGVRAIYDKCLA